MTGTLNFARTYCPVNRWIIRGPNTGLAGCRMRVKMKAWRGLTGKYFGGSWICLLWKTEYWGGGGGGWVASFTGQIKLTLVSLRGLTQIFSRASPAVLYGRNPTPGVISVSLFVRYSVCLPTCLPVCLPDSLSDYVSKHYVCIFFIVLLLSFVDKYESIHRQLSVPHWAMPPIVRVPALLKSFLSK